MAHQVALEGQQGASGSSRFDRNHGLLISWWLKQHTPRWSARRELAEIALHRLREAGKFQDR